MPLVNSILALLTPLGKLKCPSGLNPTTPDSAKPSNSIRPPGASKKALSNLSERLDLKPFLSRLVALPDHPLLILEKIAQRCWLDLTHIATQSEH